MIKISYAKENEKTGLLRLGIVRGEESFAYTVDRALYDRLGRPVRGDVINENDLALAAESDRVLRAKRAALSLLSYADNNERGLYLKLRRRGFDSETAKDTVDEMVSRGYVNEEKQLERILCAEANVKLRGPKKILPLLVSKGYPLELVRRVLSRLCDAGEIDFESNAERLVEKKMPDGCDFEQRRVLLYKSGF